jgi:hypothetical protein
VHHTCWRWPLSSRNVSIPLPPPSHFLTLTLSLFLTFSLFFAFNRVECFHLLSPPIYSTTILNLTNACNQLLFWGLIPTNVTSLKSPWKICDGILKFKSYIFLELTGQFILIALRICLPLADVR